MFEEKLEFAKLKGKALRAVRTGAGRSIAFELSDGSVYALDCPRRPGEEAPSYEVRGELNDLVGAAVLSAELSTCDDEAFTPGVWYRLTTAKGLVSIGVRGELSGFYSVAVEFLTLRDSRVESARESGMPEVVHDVDLRTQSNCETAYRITMTISSQGILNAEGRRRQEQTRICFGNDRRSEEPRTSGGICTLPCLRVETWGTRTSGCSTSRF